MVLLPCVPLDPVDQLGHRVSQAPRDHQELTASQVILERMEKWVLMDLQVFQEPQEMLDQREKREIVERVLPAPGVPQVHLDPQDQE